MAVYEFSIFGISLSTIANLLVALGTILLAIYTCKSVKTSERQLKILQRDQEKPQARDLIRGILYDVNIELTHEIKAITNSDIIWIKSDSSPNSPIYPLIFTGPSQKDFYDNFRQNFFEKTVLADKRIPILIESIEQKIRERHEIFTTLSEDMILLEDEIERVYVNTSLDDLLLKFTSISFTSKTTDLGKTYQINNSNNVSIAIITHEDLKNVIKSLLISALFKPFQIGDFRITLLKCDSLTRELSPSIADLIIQQNQNQQIAKIKKNFDNDLARLQKADENIIKNIQEIKDIYQNMYGFGKSDMDPLWGKGAI